MAQWVEFTADFPWHVPGFRGRVTKMFKAGARNFVPQPCADEAIARGKAHLCKKPGSAAEPEKPAEKAKAAPVYASGAGSSEAGSN